MTNPVGSQGRFYARMERLLILKPAPLRQQRSRLLVVVQPQVRNRLLTGQVPQRVLQLHLLNEQIMLRIQSRRGHWALEIEGQPLLDATHTRTRGEIHEDRQVEYDRRSQDGIATQEIDFDLHRI